MRCYSRSSSGLDQDSVFKGILNLGSKDVFSLFPKGTGLQLEEAEALSELKEKISNLENNNSNEMWEQLRLSWVALKTVRQKSILQETLQKFKSWRGSAEDVSSCACRSQEELDLWAVT